MRASTLMILTPALLAACQDKGVSVYNTEPTASILAPEDGAAVDAGSLVEFYGVVGDAQTDTEAIAVSWSSDLDGELDTAPAAVDGSVYFASSSLSGGDHAVTLTAIDAEGLSAQATVQLHVGTGPGGPGSPTVVILGPTGVLG